MATESTPPPKSRPPKLGPRQSSAQSAQQPPAGAQRKPSGSGGADGAPRAKPPKLGPRKSSAAASSSDQAGSKPAQPAERPSPVPRQSSGKVKYRRQDSSSGAAAEPAAKKAAPAPEKIPEEPPAEQQRQAPPQSPAKPKLPKLGPRKAASGAGQKAEPAAGAKPAAADEAEPKAQEEPSLTTLLDTRQRSQLTILLAATTAAMRDRLSAAFEAESPEVQRASGLSEDEKIMNASVDPGTADVGALDRERKALEARRKEVASKPMQALKKEAEAFFDDWREAVIGRVGEVVSSGRKAKREIGGAEEKELKPEGKSARERKIEVDGDGGGSADEDAERVLKELYPAVRTPLARLAEDERVLVLHSVLLLLLSMEHYASLSRILLLHLMSALGLSLRTLKRDEDKTAQGLLEAAKEMTAQSEAQQRAEQYQKTRRWKVGLASVAGAAIVGATGGMAAPMVAAGVGSMMGGLGLGTTAAAGYLGSVAGSSVLVGSLFGAYGGRMTGQMMDNYAREVSDFGFVPVHRGSLLSNKSEADAGKQDPGSRRLRVTIGITGWLTEKEEVVRPWTVLGRGSEAFALRWELEALMNLGNAMSELVSSAAWGYAQKELVSRTIFAELSSAMWPIALVKAARVVDNPFSLAKSRAEKAGEVLADALVNRAQGERPVNLIGYSLGARVIYSCLLKLAERNAFGLVENVVLIGAPLPSHGADWRRMRAVVAGRLVNVFSENDYVLGFLYRTSSIQYGVAGLQRVDGVTGVENVDVSQSVSGHLRYRFMIGSILKKIGFEDLDLKEVKKEEAALKKMDEEEAKRSEELKKKLPANLGKKGKDSDQISEADAEKEADEMQENVEAKTKTSMMQRSVDLFNMGWDVKKQYDEARGQSYLTYATEFLPKRGEDNKKKSEKGKVSAQKAKVPEKKEEAAEEAAEEDMTQSKTDADSRSFLNKASGGWMGASGKKNHETESTDENVSSYTNISSYTESFVEVDDENTSDETSS